MSNYLMHYGILGQKWGVRRYQNEDGTLTEAGRKRYQKQNFKDIKKKYESNNKSKYGMPYWANSSVKESVTDAAKKVVTFEDIKKVSDARKKFVEISNSTEDFFDSDECKEAEQKAYDDTINWFKKNEPSYLNKIIKENDGTTEYLDKFHGFRKALEGFEDEALDKAEKKWSKTERGTNRKKADDAFVDYQIECKNVSNKILGKYGDEKLEKFDKYSGTYNDLVYHNINWDELNKMYMGQGGA